MSVEQVFGTICAPPSDFCAISAQETFGTTALEKIAYILEQVRLCLDKEDLPGPRWGKRLQGRLRHAWARRMCGPYCLEVQ